MKRGAQVFACPRRPDALEGPERLIGSRVLDFELKAVLGAGGMSVVYRGEHRVTGQEVAIKILPPELAVHEELKARFVEEARVLAKLEHPNIVHLNNFTEAGGRLCLVMQYVEGVTFESMIVKRGKVAPDEALQVGIEVCRALEYAHAQGVVHRDIKPSNILVRADGAVKVTDFGIAKMIGNSRLTSTGQTMGTVRYMSPEQVRGKAADARSDIYSLGITLYEALAGHTPFDGENHFDIMQQHLRNRPPPLAKMGVTVPPAVEKALLTALEKSAADRYADAAQFRAGARRRRCRSCRAAATRPSRRRAGGARAAWRRRSAWRCSSSAAPARPSSSRASSQAGGAGDERQDDEARRDRSAPQSGVAAKPQADDLAAAARDRRRDRRHRRDASRPTGCACSRPQKRDATKVRDDVRAHPRRRCARGWPTSDVPAARALAERLPSAAAQPRHRAAEAARRRLALWPDCRRNRGLDLRLIATSTTKRTLFVNDTKGFERRDLPYGVAPHVLTRVPALDQRRHTSARGKV